MAEPRDVRIETALISVFDKSGLTDFAAALVARGVRLISTGGSARALRDAGLAVTDVAEATGFPEMMDGRVKTLHPAIHGGLLARRDDPAHLSAMSDHGIDRIDLVVCNLYPFEEARERGASYGETVENIDIGGPAMIRSAAKNHDSVAVVVDPEDYGVILDETAAHHGRTTATLRRRLAQKAFARTAAYDTMIGQWLAAEVGDKLPAFATFGGARTVALRYGENPHQEAALYRSGEARPGVAAARQVQGKPLSYNNLNDTDAAFECLAELGSDRPAAVIVKHANPCGVARAGNLLSAYRTALRCDPVSAFGGIIALNQTIDAETAGAIADIFTEVVIAPDADEEACATFAAKPGMRLLLTGAMPDPGSAGLTAKTIAGGLLVQTRDVGRVEAQDLKTVTIRAPSATEFRDLVFAFRVAKHVKSNTIVYAKDEATVGVGAGQMSRVDAALIAAKKAADAAKAAGEAQSLAVGSVVASDAFFPFADGLMAAVDAGATAVIQPGGSVRDDEVVAAADKAGVAMVFTGMRHFKH